MFAETIFTVLSIAGILFEATHALQTVTSPSGVVYNCPDIETIEVAYAGSCPAYTKDMSLANTGAYSSVYYSGAPSSYRVKNGYYSLECVYGTTEPEPQTCYYNSGSDEKLTPDSYNGANCPDVGQTFPAPSPTPTPTPIGERSLTKRYDQSPEYNCPWTSDGNLFTYTADINLGNKASAGSEISYVCYVRIPGSGYTMCSYRSEGTIDHTWGDAQYCPTHLCSAQKSMRRSLKRGVYVEDSPIHSRQVSADALRQPRNKRNYRQL